MTDQNVLDGRTYYHGTSPSSAICILQEGFRVLDKEVCQSGALGTGIYVTRNLSEALLFSNVRSRNSVYVLQLEFAPGTKVARLEEQPDRQVLDSLRREFGQEILGPNFVQAIPKNKHLKPRELFALISHFEQLETLFEPATKRHVRRWLQRLGYHGYGHTHNDLGVMLFDPSRLVMQDIKRLPRPVEDPHSVKLDPSALLPFARLELAADAEAELRDAEEWLREDEEDPELESDEEYQRTLAAELAELDRRRKLLHRYKDRQGIM